MSTDRGDGVLEHVGWVRWWKAGDVPWQKEQIDPFLMKNRTTLFGSAKKRVFVPLCGKSPDLLWMYEQGHTVVGVEIAEQPVEELFQENHIDHVVEKVHRSGKIYKSKDNKLIILAANMFDIPPLQYGQFDVIWDSQSFTALNLDDHERYRDLIYTVMKPGCIWFLKTLEYDGTVWPGPPHSTDDNVVRRTFSGKCNIKLLEEASPPGYGPDKKLKDGVPVGSSDNEGKMTKTSIETKSSVAHTERVPHVENKPGDFINPLLFVKRSSYIIDRWYKMSLK